MRARVVASGVSDSVTLWTAALQAPLCVGFSRQEHWGALPRPPPGIFLTRGSNLHLLRLLHWQVGGSPAVPPGKPNTDTLPSAEFHILFGFPLFVLQVHQSSWLLRVSRPRPFLRPPWFLVTLTILRSAGRAFCGRSLSLAVLVFSTITVGCECLEGGPQRQTRFLSRRVKGAHGRGASSLSMLTLLSWQSCVC